MRLQWNRSIALGAVFAVASVSAVVAGCGGGGGSSNNSGNTSGAASTGFASGPINGFGSIIVNGIRFEDSAATKVNDDGEPIADSALQLGVVVNVDGVITPGTTDGVANRITLQTAELTGDVTSFGPGAFSVLGTTVSITPTTLVVGNVTTGAVVEVHGIPGAPDDETGPTFTATRIEVKATTVAAYNGIYRIRGVVSERNSSGDTEFLIGPINVLTTGDTRVDGIVANGAFVDARLTPVVSVADTVYSAQRVSVKNRGFAANENRLAAEVEGVITMAPGGDGNGRYTIAGFSVDVSPSTLVTDGTRSSLTAGQRVEAKGRVTNGVMAATEIEVDTFDQGERGSSGDAPFEFKGLPSNVQRTGVRVTSFTISGQRILVNEATFNPASLATAPNFEQTRVEVKAFVGKDSSFEARKIEADD